MTFPPDPEGFTRVLKGYVKLATWGLSDAEVDDLFLNLQERIREVNSQLLSHWSKELRKKTVEARELGVINPQEAVDIETENLIGEPLSKLMTELVMASSRSSKIIALDHIFHLQHETGLFLDYLFGLPPGGSLSKWSVKVLDKLRG